MDAIVSLENSVISIDLKKRDVKIEQCTDLSKSSFINSNHKQIFTLNMQIICIVNKTKKLIRMSPSLSKYQSTIKPSEMNLEPPTSNLQPSV